MKINLIMPENFKVLRSGYIWGEFISEKNLSSQRCSESLIIDENISHKYDPCVIGEIYESKTMPFTRSRKDEISHPIWLILQANSLQVLNLIVHNENRIDPDINIVLYNSKEIKESYLLSKITKDKCLSDNLNHLVDKINKVNIIHEDFDTSNVHFLLSSTFNYLENLIFIFHRIIYKHFDIFSFFLNQLRHRFKQFKSVTINNKNERLEYYTLVFVLLSDIVLGVLSSSLILYYTSSQDLFILFQQSSLNVANNVQQLLKWLESAPAGLKLNQPLAEALSSFFSYHVYLWVLYLDVASPLLYFIIQIFIFIGVFGISFQICLLADFLNFAVLHVHCFYIYAARLHMIQISILGSQWRAFRGRKWNPLKRRVDERPEQPQDQLAKILSAVCFTLVIFLLPTATVYYSVFVSLRIVLTCLFGLVSLLVWCINCNPLYICILHLLKSPTLQGNLHFKLMESKLNNHLNLKLCVSQSPLKYCISKTMSSKIFPDMPKPDWSRIRQSLLYAKELL